MRKDCKKESILIQCSNIILRKERYFVTVKTILDIRINISGQEFMMKK